MAPRGITRGEVVVLLDDLREEVLALYRDHGLEIDRLKKRLADPTSLQSDARGENKMGSDGHSVLSAAENDPATSFEWPDKHAGKEDGDAGKESGDAGKATKSRTWPYLVEFWLFSGNF